MADDDDLRTLGSPWGRSWALGLLILVVGWFMPLVCALPAWAIRGQPDLLDESEREFVTWASVFNLAPFAAFAIFRSLTVVRWGRDAGWRSAIVFGGAFLLVASAVLNLRIMFSEDEWIGLHVPFAMVLTFLATILGMVVGLARAARS